MTNYEERIDISGWKGKDEIELYERVDAYRLVEHRKHKETGELYENEHIIPKENVRVLWNIIKGNCDLRVEYKYRYLVRKLVEMRMIDLSKIIPSFLELDSFMRNQNKDILEKWFDFVTRISMETFNGGKFRKEVYFPYLYYPLKCLEAFDYIIYYGRGSVMRISDERELPPYKDIFSHCKRKLEKLRNCPYKTSKNGRGTIQRIVESHEVI